MPWAEIRPSTVSCNLLVDWKSLSRQKHTGNAPSTASPGDVRLLPLAAPTGRYLSPITLTTTRLRRWPSHSP